MVGYLLQELSTCSLKKGNFKTLKLDQIKREFFCYPFSVLKLKSLFFLLNKNSSLKVGLNYVEFQTVFFFFAFILVYVNDVFST